MVARSFLDSDNSIEQVFTRTSERKAGQLSAELSEKEAIEART